MALGFADDLAYLAEDENLRIIACYIESMRDSAEFFEPQKGPARSIASTAINPIACFSPVTGIESAAVQLSALCMRYPLLIFLSMGRRKG